MLSLIEVIRANALPVNEDLDYSSLQVGTEFPLLWKVSLIVGGGLVKEIFNIHHMRRNSCRGLYPLECAMIRIVDGKPYLGSSKRALIQSIRSGSIAICPFRI